MNLPRELAALAQETDFAGVAVAHDGGRRLAEVVAGFADRAERRPIAVDTRFGTASATKGLTALAVARLVERGELDFDTSVRELVGDDLPDVDPAVTIESLLGHTSGVGDYLDEDQLDDVDDYVLDTPVHLLTAPDAYLPMVAEPPQVSPPGTRFAYNNGGYVMLSIAVERATGRSFYDVVDDAVLEPAGMHDSGFFRSDDLPAGAALGYLGDGRTNVFHLPVRGAGDGGAYATVADVESLWAALFAGRIVGAAMVERLTTPRRDVPGEGLRYGLGFWIAADRPTVMLEGMDAGVSFRSAHDPPSGCGYTVVSNTSDGAWPLVEVLDAWLAHVGPDGVADTDR